MPKCDLCDNTGSLLDLQTNKYVPCDCEYSDKRICTAPRCKEERVQGYYYCRKHKFSSH